MLIGEKLRALREHKKLSQGHIEKRTGLLRCYISRVENNHTVPALETLEKLAHALEIPMYQLFYDGDELPAKLVIPTEEEKGWGAKGRDRRTMDRFRILLKRARPADQKLLLFMASKMATTKRKRSIQ